jgi:hypothetical protein
VSLVCTDTAAFLCTLQSSHTNTVNASTMSKRGKMAISACLCAKRRFIEVNKHAALTSVPRLSSLIWLATPLPPNTATDDSATARPSRFTSCSSRRQ